MKLIIDIPDNWEEKVLSMSDGEIANCLYSICRGGTPLEDIKAEINKEMMRRNYPNWSANIERTKGFQKALEIISKHIGEEE